MFVCEERMPRMKGMDLGESCISFFRFSFTCKDTYIRIVIVAHCHTLSHIVTHCRKKISVSDKNRLLELFSTNYNDNSGNPELPSTIVDEYFGRQKLSPTHVDENEMIHAAKITNVDECIATSDHS